MHRDYSLLSIVADGKDGLHFKKCSLYFFKVLVPIFRAKPKMYDGFLFLQNIDCYLSPNFQGNVFGSS